MGIHWQGAGIHPKMEKLHCGRTRVQLNVNIMFYTNKLSAIIRTIDTIFYSLSFVKSALGRFVALKYV